MKIINVSHFLIYRGSASFVQYEDDSDLKAFEVFLPLSDSISIVDDGANNLNRPPYKKLLILPDTLTLTWD